MHNNDSISIQERWQVTDQLNIFQKRISQMLSQPSTTLNFYRVVAMAAALWKSSFKLLISPLICSNNRICAVKVKVKPHDGGNEFAIFNIYMAIDTQHDRGNSALFDAILGNNDNDNNLFLI